MICGKEIYNSRSKANSAIKGANKDNRNNRLTTSYYCKDCDGWHVSSKSKPKSMWETNHKQEVNIDAMDRRERKSNSQRWLMIQDYTGKK